MNKARSAAFAWAGNPQGAAFFLEEALGEWRANSSLDPLVADCQSREKQTLSLPVANGKGMPLKALRHLGNSGIPYCRIENLLDAWDEAGKKKQASYFDGKTLILVPQRGQVAKAMELADELLFLCPAEKDSVSALYNVAVALNGLQNRSVGITVVVSETAEIEVAAEFFLSMREELSNLALLNAELRFAGHFAVQADKMAIAASAGRPYRSLFAEDGMYGMIKAIGRRWLPCLTLAPNAPAPEALARRAADIFVRP